MCYSKLPVYYNFPLHVRKMNLFERGAKIMLKILENKILGN